MSIIVIKKDPCLTIEYSPTLVERTLEMFLTEQSNALGMARYSPECRADEDGNPQVFSFIRDAVKPIKGLKLKYEKMFNSSTTRKPLNYIIENFNQKELFTELIAIGDKRGRSLYLELSNHTGKFLHYGEEIFESNLLKRIWGEFCLFYPVKNGERARVFKWKEQELPSHFETYMGIIFGEALPKGKKFS